MYCNRYNDFGASQSTIFALHFDIGFREIRDMQAPPPIQIDTSTVSRAQVRSEKLNSLSRIALQEQDDLLLMWNIVLLSSREYGQHAPYVSRIW